MNVMTLLDQVERGDLSVSEAAKMIKDSPSVCSESLTTFSENRPPAKWLKIKIADPESNFKLNLPPLPLRLTGKLTAFLLKITLQHTEVSDVGALDYKDLRLILETLKELPPFQLVSVVDDQGTQIEIFTK